MVQNELEIKNLQDLVRDGEHAAEQKGYLDEHIRRIETHIAKAGHNFDVTFEARMLLSDYEYQLMNLVRRINAGKNAAAELLRINGQNHK